MLQVVQVLIWLSATFCTWECRKHIWINVLKFSSSSENEHCHNSTLASLIYFLAIQRKLSWQMKIQEWSTANYQENGETKSSRKAKHEEHPLAVLFLSVTEETSFVISQIQSIPLFHHRLVPYPVKKIIFVSRCYIKAKYFQQIT